VDFNLVEYHKPSTYSSLLFNSNYTVSILHNLLIPLTITILIALIYSLTHFIRSKPAATATKFQSILTRFSF